MILINEENGLYTGITPLSLIFHKVDKGTAYRILLDEYPDKSIDELVDYVESRWNPDVFDIVWHSAMLNECAKHTIDRDVTLAAAVTGAIASLCVQRQYELKLRQKELVREMRPQLQEAIHELRKGLNLD